MGAAARWHSGGVSALGDRPVAGENLPEPIPDRAVVLAAPPRVVADLARDLTGAAGAVRSLPATGRGDVTISAYTAVVCSGRTAADALGQAADWCLQAPQAEVHATAWARVPGDREDEYQVTLTVSFPDEQTGEHTGDTHHATDNRVSPEPHERQGPHATL